MQPSCAAHCSRVLKRRVWQSTTCARSTPRRCALWRTRPERHRHVRRQRRRSCASRGRSGRRRRRSRPRGSRTSSDRRRSATASRARWTGCARSYRSGQRVSPSFWRAFPKLTLLCGAGGAGACRLVPAADGVLRAVSTGRAARRGGTAQAGAAARAAESHRRIGKPTAEPLD